MSTPQKRALYNTRKDEELIVDCRAAYLSVFNTIKDSINNLDDLRLVLQQTGRNPSKKSLEKYRKNVKASMSFDDFCKICPNEPQTTAVDLVQAFQCLDADGDGYISYNKLLNLMTTKGEKMSTAEAKLLIEELNVDSNRMVNYKTFSRTMEETILKTKEVSKMLMNSKLKNPAGIPSGSSLMNTDNTFTNKSVDLFQSEKKSKTLSAAVEAFTVAEPKKIKTWTHLKSCGCFFFDNMDITSHQFRLSLSTLTNVWITIFPVFGPENLSKKDPEIDTMLCIFKCKPGGTKHFVALSEMKTKTGKFCIRCDLSAGNYILIPFTTGCRFRPRSSQPEENIPLIKRSTSGEVTLTKDFKKSLEKIFDLCDLDRNGKLNRKELSFFHYCTSGEQLTAQEWQIVEEKFDLADGELTQLGFLNLHEMEAEDNNGDAEDLWITLDSMGLNRALILDQAFQFELNVFLEECPEAILDVLDVEIGGVDLEKAICQSVINKGLSRPVGGSPNILVHEYYSEVRYTTVVQNLSKSDISVCIDNSGSLNCCSNTNEFRNIINVQPSSCKVCHFMVPCNEQEPWTIECSATII